MNKEHSVAFCFNGLAGSVPERAVGVRSRLRNASANLFVGDDHVKIVRSDKLQMKSEKRFGANRFKKWTKMPSAVTSEIRARYQFRVVSHASTMAPKNEMTNENSEWKR